jgi:hypothetical protein
MGGAAAWSAFVRARSVPPEIPVDTSPQAVRRAEEAVETAAQTVRAAARAADTAASGPRRYRVRLRQDDLNTLVRTDARARRVLAEHGIERPRLEIVNGQLKAGGVVSYHGQRVYVSAAGPVEPLPGGRIRFRPEQVWIGQLRAPAAFTREIARRIAEASERGDLRLPGQIESLRLQDGALVLDGVTPAP